MPLSQPFDRPVFIVAAPRSGSTLLFEALAANPAFVTLGGEGHAPVEAIPALQPRNRGYDSNRLTAADATPETTARLAANYLAGLRTSDGRRATPAENGEGQAAAIRFLEKTPKNALRIPMFKAMFPDAKFIFLHREPRANISAIIEAWRSGRFVTYRDLPGWTGLRWSLLLIPGWRELIGRELAEIAMRQWRDTNARILDDLAALSPADWSTVRYEDLLADAAGELARLCAFAEVPFGAAMAEIAAKPLRASRYTLTAPDPEKWRKNEAAIAPYLSAAQGTIDRLARLERRAVSGPGRGER